MPPRCLFGGPAWRQALTLGSGRPGHPGPRPPPPRWPPSSACRSFSVQNQGRVRTAGAPGPVGPSAEARTLRGKGLQPWGPGAHPAAGPAPSAVPCLARALGDLHSGRRPAWTGGGPSRHLLHPAPPRASGIPEALGPGGDPPALAGAHGEPGRPCASRSCPRGGGRSVCWFRPPRPGRRDRQRGWGPGWDGQLPAEAPGATFLEGRELGGAWRKCAGSRGLRTALALTPASAPHDVPCRSTLLQCLVLISSRGW